MQQIKKKFKVGVIILLVALFVTLASVGIFYTTNKAKATTVESSLDAYARYDATSGQIVMGTDKVKRVVSFTEGKYMTTELTDLVANITYVNPTTKQNEFGFDVGGVSYKSDQLVGGRTWDYVSSNCKVDTQKELVFECTVSNGQFDVTKTYIIYPGTSIIQERATIKNVSGGTVSMSTPGIFDRWIVGIDGKSTDFHYMTGNGNFSGAAIFKTVDLSTNYYRTFNSLTDEIEHQVIEGYSNWGIANKEMGSGVYNQFFALRNRNTQNGMFFLFDYQGAWTNQVFFDNDMKTLGMDGRVQMNGLSMKNGDSLSTPLTLVGFWKGDTDDLGNTLGEYQANYKWDYTDDENRTPRTTQWVQGRQTDNFFELAMLQRYIGSGTVHIDCSWFDASGDWNNTNYDDFKQINDFVKRSGGPGVTIWMPIWMVYYQSELAKEHPEWVVENWEHFGGGYGTYEGYGSHLDFSREDVYQWALNKLTEAQQKWGSFMWRFDAEPVTLINGSPNSMLQASNNFYRLLKEFRDKNPEASIHGCSSGGEGITIESVRYVTIQQPTDGACGAVGNYWLSLIVPSVKLQPGNMITMDLTSEWMYGNLPFTDEACLISAAAYCPDEGFNEEDKEFSRKYHEIYWFLTQEGVRSKDSKYYRPLASYNGATVGETKLFQQFNKDKTKGILCINKWDEMVGKTFTVFPKGLNKTQQYTVSSLKGKVNSATKTGEEWMNSGITVNGLVPGELIFFNLENRPRNGTDKIAPTAPTSLTVAEASYVGRSGVDLDWSGATDENFISYYNIYRNGQYVDRVSFGKYYFAKNGSVYDNWQVTAVDGDGNESAKVSVTKATIENNKYGTSYDFTTEQGMRGWNYYESKNDAKTQLVWNEDAKMYQAQDGSFVKNDIVKLVNNDITITWKVQQTGLVNLLGEFAKVYRNVGGDGVLINIKYNSSDIYSVILNQANVEGVTYDNYCYVNKGDTISVTFNQNKNNSNDKFYYKLTIKYVDKTSTGLVNPTAISFADKLPTDAPIGVPEKTVDLAVGTKTRLGVNFKPTNAIKNVKFTIVNGSDIISLNADTGEVIAQKVGSATIKVESLVNNSLSDTLQVNVYDASFYFDSQNDYFSTQGFKNWSYISIYYNNFDNQVDCTYDAANQKWIGAEQYAEITQKLMHPGGLWLPARVFTAPYNGTIKVDRYWQKSTASGNGVVVDFYHNRTLLQSYTCNTTDKASHTDSRVLNVTKGDRLIFLLGGGAGFDINYDSTAYTATVTYTNVTSQVSRGSINISATKNQSKVAVGEIIDLSIVTNPTSLASNLAYRILDDGHKVIGFDSATKKLIGLQKGIAVLEASTPDGIVKGYFGIEVVENSGNGFVDGATQFSSEQGKNNWYYSYSQANTNLYYHLTNYSNGLWSGLDWLNIKANVMHPDNGYDAVKSYLVPCDGTIVIRGSVKKDVSYFGSEGGNGVKALIYLNDQLKYSKVISANDNAGVVYDITLQVKKGDVISYRLNDNGELAFDTVIWNIFTKIEKSNIDNAVVSGLDALINALPSLENITIVNRAEVERLMSIYNGLQDKTIVNNANKLLEINEKMQLLIEQERQLTLVNGLIDLIDLQKVDEVLVGLARTAYNGLTLEQQTLVINYNNLVSAENLLKA